MKEKLRVKTKMFQHEKALLMRFWVLTARDKNPKRTGKKQLSLRQTLSAEQILG